MNQSDLEIYWSRVPANQVDSVVVGYYVRLVDEDSEVGMFISCASTNNITLSNLTLYHTYCVTVAAIGRKGRGPESEKKCAMMDDGGINNH